MLVLYTLVGFFGVPWGITTKLPPLLEEELGRPVSITDAKFNPYLLTLQVVGLEIRELDGSPLVGFEELFVDFEPSTSIWNQAYTFSNIRIHLPFGMIRVRPDGSLNLAELGSAEPSVNNEREDPLKPPVETSEDSGGIPPVLIEELAIQQGLVEFVDASRPTPFEAHLVPINLNLEKFSTQRGRANPYALSAELSDGEQIQWEGAITLEPLRSEGKLALNNIQLPALWAYLQDQFRFLIPQGLMTLEGHYEILMRGEDLDVRVDGAQVALRDVQVQEKGENVPIIDVPLFDVKDISVNLFEQSVNIAMVQGNKARFRGWLDKNGEVNYQALFSPVQGEGNGETRPEDSKSSSDDPPWRVLVQDVNLENFTVEFEDRQPEIPVPLLLESLNFHTRGVSSTMDRPLPVDLSFRFNKTAQADLNGTLNVEPLIVDLDLFLKNVALRPFQPYLAPFVQFDVSSGALTLQGKTHVQQGSDTKPFVTFAGSIGLSRLALMDPSTSEPFFQWEMLALKQLDLALEPTVVTLQELVLLEPRATLLIDASGEMNVKRLFSPPGQEKEEKEEKDDEASSEEASSPPPPIKVGAVRLDKAEVQIADRSVSPNVVTHIQGITGSIEGLSSEQLAKADVALKGKIDRYAPFSIEGQINPLSEEAYTDVTVLFENLDLTTVSPYSGKYAGYPINKGKLFLDLVYKLSEKELVGENKVLVDQITMGSHIDSPDAPSLPIPLALALLKDRKGQIDIDLPVRGNLDDPEFSYGGIIWQALVNLITKVATSPFSIVGGLVGGLVEWNADDLQFVAFPAGESVLPPPEQEKLSALAKALADRPGLRLDVTGAADPDLDKTALAARQLQLRLQKAKFVEQAPGEKQAKVAVEQIELTPEEERHFLTQLYVQAFGSSTVPPAGEKDSSETKPQKPGPLSLEAKKTRLLKKIVIHDEHLRALAQERAKGIRDYLVQVGTVPQDHVFLIEANLSPVTEEGTVRSPLALAAY